MLVEIQCEEFKCCREPRTAIRFHKGLNVVLGGSSGENSIGKSTFLMIIDFVFGGSDYLQKSTDVHQNVQAHVINFAFEFKGKRYYFSRSTTTSGEVHICDENYRSIRTIALMDYHTLLLRKYGFTDPSTTFRAAVGKFFRVYLRECCDEGHPLRSADKAPEKDGIIDLLKLFDKYSTVEELQKAYAEAESKEKTFKKAASYHQIAIPKGKREYDQNASRIVELE